MRSEIIRYLGHKPVPITPRRLATSQYSGEWASPYTGKGMDFRSHRAFELGDDPRTIHMPMSVRAGKRMVIDRIAMRDISIFVMIDCSPSMAVRDKLKILSTTAMVLLISGMMLEMRVGVILVSDEGYQSLGSGMGQRKISSLLERVEESSQLLGEGRTQHLSFIRHGIYRILPAGCMLFHLSDFLAADGAPQFGLPLKLNTIRYDYVPVVIQDEYECTFPDNDAASLLKLRNPETGSIYPVWLGNDERRRLRTLHQTRFSQIKDRFSRTGTGFIHIPGTDLEQVHSSLSRFFLYR